jgi:hypothetical protein
MAAVTQSRALAGCRMSMQAKQTVKVTNGAKYFMRRRDSYMVEVRHRPQPERAHERSSRSLALCSCL